MGLVLLKYNEIAHYFKNNKVRPPLKVVSAYHDLLSYNASL